MPSPEVERFHRVAGHVRKKLVQMALAHKSIRPPPEEAGPHTDSGEGPEHDMGIRSDPKAAAKMEGADQDQGSAKGADEHMHPDLTPGELPEPSDKGSLYPKLQLGNPKHEHVSAHETPDQHEMGTDVAEHAAMKAAQHDPNHQRVEEKVTVAMEKRHEPKSGSEDHGWAEHETDAEHSAEPDSERMAAEDPGSGEADWQKMVGNRRIGKTAKGIIGAYKGGR